ncbi:MAG: hypothetical protein V3V14_07910 [Saprospiraceae bacterium]
MFVVVLPFLLLLRGSIYFHSNYNLGPWISLLAGVMGTSVILFIYITIVYKKMTRKIGDTDNLQRRGLFALSLVIMYCVYGLFFMSSENVKNPSLKTEISDMHPILRMGVSTFVLLDKKLIVTDASRQPEDYRKMGLKTSKRSLHYKQTDGYAYAVDLRTNGRNEMRNKIMFLYFRLLGFNTLRHIGTADHLHVSLACHYNKGAI